MKNNVRGVPCGTPLFVEDPAARLGVAKSFSYAPFRRSGKLPSDEGGGFAVGKDGGRETRRKILSPSQLR